MWHFLKFSSLSLQLYPTLHLKYINLENIYGNIHSLIHQHTVPWDADDCTRTHRHTRKWVYKCNLLHVRKHSIFTLFCHYYIFPSSRNFSLKIINSKFKTLLIVKYILLIYLEKKCYYWFPQINHYLSLLDTDILLYLHFHKQCICSKSTWTSWLIHRLLMLHSTA